MVEAATAVEEEVETSERGRGATIAWLFRVEGAFFGPLETIAL